MVYNDKYFFEFDTLKTRDKAVLYYRVVFSKKEAIEHTYDLVELTPSNSPFVLSYKSSEDFAFSPFRVSSAEINILYPFGASADVPTPDDFFTSTDNSDWLVRLYAITDNGATSTLNWQGFLITSDIQYEWQDAYYYRLTATDNLGVLKDIKYSRTDRFAMREFEPESGQSVLGFIYDALELTGNLLNIKIACNYKVNGVTLDFEEIFTSKFAYIDWNKTTPMNIYEVLSKLIRSFGCILYQDNRDATWTILNINEIATSTNNEVYYKLYNADGFIEDGYLDLYATINVDDTAVWRDVNQIVTINKPINTIRFLFPYRPKNLLNNYGFQDSSASPSNWSNTFTSSTNEVRVDNPLGRFNTRIFPKNYDDYYFYVGKNELISSSPQGTEYLDSNFFAPTTLFSHQKFLHVKFDFQIPSTADEDEGFNFQLYATRSSDEIFYDNSDITNAFGTWYIANSSSNPAPRIPVFSNGGKQGSISLITSGVTTYMESIGIRFLPFRYNTVQKNYNIDNVQLNVLAQKHKDLVKTGYFASNNTYQTNELVFDDMMFIGGEDTRDNNVFEDWICIQNGASPAELTTSNLWTRQWETSGEENDKMFNELALLSIVSFYRSPSRKISGNVYSDSLKFAQYLAISGAYNKSYATLIADTFEARVLADEGTVEESLCGADFLAEFNLPPSSFLMVEAAFDYAQSTINVNLHEDFTNTNELDFYSGIGGSVIEPGGIFGTFTGGATISPQGTITTG